MVCLACGRWAAAALCAPCAGTMASVSERVLPNGLLVRAPFSHEGAARTLVRSLKYRGLLDAAEFFAAEMARLLPAEARALVPVPRAPLRRLRFGIDPAAELAGAIARRTSLPVAAALRAPLWWPSHAGAGRRRRRGIGFVAGRVDPRGAVLVDDVATTGATLVAACAGLKGLPALALTATAVGKVPTGVYPTHRVWEVT